MTVIIPPPPSLPLPYLNPKGKNRAFQGRSTKYKPTNLRRATRKPCVKAQTEEVEAGKTRSRTGNKHEK